MTFDYNYDIGREVEVAMTPCSHPRTEFLYRRDGIDYVRCIGCNTVFDAEDLESVPIYDELDEESEVPVHVHAGRRR